MKEIRVKYTGQKVQDAAMQEDPKALDEVIIVAWQNINELDIRAKSGVVQRVDVERLNSKPMIDMSLALQGTVRADHYQHRRPGLQTGNSYSRQFIFP